MSLGLRLLLLAPILAGPACATRAPPPASAPRPRPPGSAPPHRPARRASAAPPSSQPSALPTSQPATPPTSQPAAAPPPPTVGIRCGSPERRAIALTFDDGPTTRFTPRVLAVLRQHRVPATFFVLGRLAHRYPQIIRTIFEQGHLVANHSWDHPRHGTREAWRRQVLRTEAAIHAAGGTPARYFRPPHGLVTPRLRSVCQELGYTIVLYTLLATDWQQPNAAALARLVRSRVASGGIVVLHDAGGDRTQTLEALPAIVRTLRELGFELVRLDDLLGAHPVVHACARPPHATADRSPSRKHGMR